MKTLVSSAAKFAILSKSKSDRKKLQQIRGVDLRKSKNSTKSAEKKTTKAPLKAAKKVIKKAPQKKKAAAKIVKRVTRSSRK